MVTEEETKRRIHVQKRDASLFLVLLLDGSKDGQTQAALLL